MTIMIIIGILASVGLIGLGIAIASCQNSMITHCFKIRKLHDDLLVGESGVSDIPNSKLLSLRSPIFTHVGMGGIGPHYRPSFEVFRMVCDELSQRRLQKV